MEDDEPDGPAGEDLKAQNQRAAVQFKAQHALVVAFFLLLLYVYRTQLTRRGNHSP